MVILIINLLAYTMHVTKESNPNATEFISNQTLFIKIKLKITSLRNRMIEWQAALKTLCSS